MNDEHIIFLVARWKKPDRRRRGTDNGV